MSAQYMDPLSAFINDVSKKAAARTVGAPASGQQSSRRRVRPVRRPRHVRARWREVPAMFKTTGAIRRVRATEYGFEAQVTLDNRHAADMLTREHKVIAGVFKVARIVAEPDRSDVSQAMLRLVITDLLEKWQGRPWPGMDAEDLSLWDPVELGFSEFGESIRLELADRPHVLLAGQTRSGKSVAMTIFVATAALSDARLFLFDANRYQLGRWQQVANEFVVNDPKHAVRVLDELLAECDRRFQLVHDHGADKLDRELAEQLDLPIMLVAIDEGADYLKVVPKFTEQLTRLCARGAAAGLRVVFGTQSPNATVIPTELRNNMQRIAFRVADGSASRVALDTTAVDASEIPFTQQGVCYVDRDGAGLTRTRTNYLTPDQVRGLVLRAAEMRS